MKYIRKEIEGKVIIIFRKPDAWLATSHENADAIESEIKNRPDHVSILLSRIQKTPRTPTAEHLALYPVIKLTNRCNLNCSHCYLEAMNSMRKAKFDLELEETTEFLKFITELGRKMGNPTRTVQLFGGEPTLSKIFLDVVRIARDMGLLVRVSTNAVSTKHFRSAEFEELYKDRGIEWRVSLESHIQTIHDQIRFNSYRQIVGNLRHMISRGAFVSIKTVVGSHNFPSFIDTLYFAKQIGATQFLYSPLSITGAATRMCLLNKITTRAINQKVVEAVERDPAIGPFIQSSPLARYLKVIYTKDPGILPRVQYHVNHDGRVSPQDNLYEFSDHHFGDINRRDYDFETLKNFQLNLEQPASYRQCPVNYYCPRGDYANLAFGNEESIGLTGEFAVCDEIRDNVYYLMTLGGRGIRIAESIFGK